MAKAHIKTVSEQSADVYRLLLDKNRALTAGEIAKELEILPNAVYRVAHKLIGLGLIKMAGNYPMEFQAVNTHSAMNWYLLAAAQSFREEFAIQEGNKAPSTDSANISFIKDRQSLLKKTDKDAREANKTIDFIVSGLEVPDDTVLAFRKASTNRVKIRAIVQRKKETSRERLEKWQGIGADVRYSDDLGFRMFIFDSKIVYLTSYSSSSKDKAFGIRFAYVPVAIQMGELFDNNWQKAKKS